jgi:hypothetical protein
VLIISILLLASTASFALGYLAGQEGRGGSGTKPADSPATDIFSDPITSSSTGKFVASKNGTKYYLPECAGVERISESNKVWFASVADAVSAGYAPAANCKGL